MSGNNLTSNRNKYSQKFICNLHNRMFGNVWDWAGKFRKTDKNIGVVTHHIPLQLRKLCGDASFWVENGIYPPEGMAIRFKHRVVSIYCFPNGNGRHSRLIADIIIEKLFNKEPFTWGAANLTKENNTRKAYLNAVKAADLNDYEPLLEFSRS